MSAWVPVQATDDEDRVVSDDPHDWSYQSTSTVPSALVSRILCAPGVRLDAFAFKRPVRLLVTAPAGRVEVPSVIVAVAAELPDAPTVVPSALSDRAVCGFPAASPDDDTVLSGRNVTSVI